MRSEVVVQGFPGAGRGGRLCFRVAILLVGVVAALGCAATLLTPPGGTRGRTTTARHGLTSLPLTAQGPVSAALGQDEPGYRVTALRANNPAQHLRAGFSRYGVTVAVGKARLGMAISAYGYTGTLEPVGSVAPRARANRVTYSYAGLTAWYANGPLGLEQGFTVAHAPARGAAGPLTVSLALSGNLQPKLTEDGHGLSLTQAGHTVLRYAALQATDARGRVLRSWLTPERGRTVLRVDTARARYPLRIDPLIQQGEKLTGSGQTGGGYFGYSVALSADDSTALVGGDQDNGGLGSAWVFTRSGETWTQQGPKLAGSGEIGPGAFGTSVALSADGSTALVGGWSDDEWDGAAWVFTRSGSTWTQQGPKLTGTARHGSLDEFGTSVALSGDGNTALVGAPRDNENAGAAWVFTRSGSTWTRQSAKLIGTGEIEGGWFGGSVALSADGEEALIGGHQDNKDVGAAWVFTRSGETWAQQGAKLTGAGEVGEGAFGESVALSGDGDTALIGGPEDNDWAGAAWVFARSGSTWTQQGSKLTGKEETAQGDFGTSVTLSEDGSTALVGAGLIDGIGTSQAAAWVFTRSGETWSQQGAKLTGAGEVGEGHFGLGVALSSDGNTALIGGPWDNRYAGAAWVFTRSGEAWSQDGAKLTGSGQTGNGEFGYSVALSADGNTAVIGGPEDNDWIGSAWVFTRSGETWTQQGIKLVGDCANDCANEGTGEIGDGRFGESVAVSADGNTALIGAPRAGAVWVFTRSGVAWTQQGAELTPTGGAGSDGFGKDVALSADGNAALIGDPDASSSGAAWVFTRSGSTWMQSAELTGVGASKENHFGEGVALSGDGETALIGGPCSYYGSGNCTAAAWVFTRSGETWTQQGSKLTGAGESADGDFGESVALSADGGEALIGAPRESERHGAAWVFTRSGETWAQQGAKLTAGDSEYGEFGDSVALSGNGEEALIGEPWDDGIVGAAWLFTRSGETWTLQGDKLTGAGEIGLGKFGGSVAISEDGATMLIGGPNGAGAVWPYVFMQISLPPELTGTGVAASSGPTAGNEKGATGPGGPVAPQGSAGPTGPTGSTGSTGKQRPAGKVEIVTCTKKGGKQTCTTKLVSGPVKLPSTAFAARATISRYGRVFATGTVRKAGGHIEFLSSNARVLPRGRYTLTITRKTGRHVTETREAITIA
jgi:FG-GAP repeat